MFTDVFSQHLPWLNHNKTSNWTPMIVGRIERIYSIYGAAAKYIWLWHHFVYQLGTCARIEKSTQFAVACWTWHRITNISVYLNTRIHKVNATTDWNTPIGNITTKRTMAPLALPPSLNLTNYNGASYIMQTTVCLHSWFGGVIHRFKVLDMLHLVHLSK